MAIQATRLLKRVNHIIEDLNRKDIAVLKIDLIFFTLLIVHFRPELGQAHWWWYLGIVVGCEIYLLQKLHLRKFFKEKKSND